jgi:hypothetical protein
MKEHQSVSLMPEELADYEAPNMTFTYEESAEE